MDAASALIINNFFTFAACNGEASLNTLSRSVGIGGHYGVTGVSQSARRLWIDHRQHLVPASRSPMAAADLCLAGLRSLPELSGAEQIPQFLAGEARGSAALGNGGPRQADPPGRNPLRRRRVPAALKSAALKS